MNNVDFLSSEELSDLKGGLITVASTQVDAIQMGNTSCCNIIIDPGKDE